MNRERNNSGDFPVTPVARTSMLDVVDLLTMLTCMLFKELFVNMHNHKSFTYGNNEKRYWKMGASNKMFNCYMHQMNHATETYNKTLV